jgi:hypothetical protein
MDGDNFDTEITITPRSETVGFEGGSNNIKSANILLRNAFLNYTILKQRHTQRQMHTFTEKFKSEKRQNKFSDIQKCIAVSPY